MLFGLTGTRARAESIVQCESVRRSHSAHGQNFVDRGVKIHYALRARPGDVPAAQDSQTLWFGRTVEFRDHGLRVCRYWVEQFECRPDGPAHTSYGRSGIRAVTREWALHSKGRGTIDTFDEPFLPFMNSAYENCMSALIEQVAIQVRYVGGRN
ncbi:MAG: hypothetical protein EBX52_13500 [Proteobacteria bacterium]|nr:hypothetical protein [Pseudomonadota bacterium]